MIVIDITLENDLSHHLQSCVSPTGRIWEGKYILVSIQRCRGVDNSEHLYLERLFPVNYFGLVHVNAQADGKHGGGVSDSGHKLGTRGNL